MSELRDLIYLIRGGRKSHFGTWVGFSPQIEVGRVERAFEELEANEKRVAELELRIELGQKYRDRLEVRNAELEQKLNEARDTNARLNRRAQQAEAAAAEWREVAAMTKEQRTGRFFPALAALSLSKAWEENDQLQALVGEILATLRVNLERGRLTSEDDADFERIMEAWAKRAKEGAK